MSKPFKFKQFTVYQDRCAMKVGTDGVLLGAWASIESNPNSILDIGAGTGVIALQLAQRSSAETIDAVELDNDAYEQCVTNLEASPWPDRLFCYHASFQEFVAEMDEPYDLVVSNPPFYGEGVSSGNSSRDKARQHQFLPFDKLLYGVSKLLSKQGVFSTIVPFTEETTFSAIAAQNGLFVNRMTRVKGSEHATIKRSLLEFSFLKTEVQPTTLTIALERHVYTEDYIALTRPFYLKM
ncbi:MAG: methyltransferase [Bacteroidota bacterium]